MKINYVHSAILFLAFTSLTACNKDYQLSESSSFNGRQEGIGIGSYNSNSENDKSAKDRGVIPVFSVADSNVATVSASQSEGALKQTFAFGDPFLAYIERPSGSAKSIEVFRCGYQSRDRKSNFYTLTLNTCESTKNVKYDEPAFQGSAWIYSEKPKDTDANGGQFLPLYVFVQEVSGHSFLKTIKLPIYMVGIADKESVKEQGFKFNRLKNKDTKKTPYILGYVEKYSAVSKRKRSTNNVGVLAHKGAVLNAAGWHIGFKHQKYLTRMSNLNNRVANLFSYKNIQINGQYIHGQLPECTNCNSNGMGFVNAIKEVHHHLYKVAFMFRNAQGTKTDTIVFERPGYDRSSGNYDITVQKEMTSIKLNYNGQNYINQSLPNDITLASGYLLHWEVAKQGNLIAYYRLSISAPKLANGNYDPDYEIERFVIEPSAEFHMIQGGIIKAEPGFNLMMLTSQLGFNPNSTLPNGTLGVSARNGILDGADIFSPLEMAYAPQGGGILETIYGSSPVLTPMSDQLAFRQFYLINGLTDTSFSHFTNCFTTCPGQKASEIIQDNNYYNALADFILTGTDNIGISNNRTDSGIKSVFGSRRFNEPNNIETIKMQIQNDYDQHWQYLGKTYNYYSDPEEDLEVTVTRGWRNFIDFMSRDFTSSFIRTNLGDASQTEHIAIRIGDNHIVSYQHNLATFINGRALNLNGARDVSFGNGFTYEQHMLEQTEDLWIYFPNHSKYFGIKVNKIGPALIAFREGRAMPSSASGIYVEKFKGNTNPDLKKLEVSKLFSK